MKKAFLTFRNNNDDGFCMIMTNPENAENVIKEEILSIDSDKYLVSVVIEDV